MLTIGPMISVRTLAALDMTLNNKWIILTEFYVGVFGIAALAYLLDVHDLFRLWLLGVAVNYIPLALYATGFIMRGDHRTVGNQVLEAGKLTRYNLQQFCIGIPFFVALVSVIQSIQNR